MPKAGKTNNNVNLAPKLKAGPKSKINKILGFLHEKACQLNLNTSDALRTVVDDTSFKTILRLVGYFGRPVFYLLYYSSLFLANVFYLTGFLTRKTIVSIFNLFVKLVQKLYSSAKASHEHKTTQKPPVGRSKIVFSNTRASKKTITDKLVKLKNNLTKRSAAVLDSIRLVIWKSQVFFLASEKLIKKLAIAFQRRFSWTRLTKLIKLLLARLKLTVVKLAARLPRVKRPRFSILKMAFVFFSLTIFAIASSAIVFWQVILRDLPSPHELSERQLGASTKIYDRNGVLLYKIYKDENRTPVSLDKIPNQVKLATIAIEDAEFYTHPGFSIKGIVRAAYKNYKTGELTGGSTITQQLVKNTLLTSEKTIIRKLKEVALAVQVELTFSKDDILEMYLNEVSYGGTAYGIQEAARTYFDKDVDKLTLAEAALLAGLPKSPTTYSPFGPNKDAALARQQEVLHLMKMNSFISEQLEQRALNQKITFAQNKTDIKAPHFVMFVREYLEQKYGKDLVEQGGLEVTTTLDYATQTLTERIVAEEVDNLQKLNVTNGAVVVVNPQSGEILAMVGSKDYFDTKADGNVNVATALRQPGSSIKIVNYAYALSHGLTAASIVKDVPTTFNVDGQKPYSPKNYEGGFRGNLTIRQALAESRNIPAVRVLASYGVDKMLDMGRRMGITTWNDPQNYGLSLTLGGGDVKLIDLAKAYATVANYGKRPEFSPILAIKTEDGQVLEQNPCLPPNKSNTLVEIANNFTSEVYATESAKVAAQTSGQQTCAEQVLDSRVAYIITDILRDNAARSRSFGTNSMLVIPGHPEVAVKTGTSNNLRDNLTVGYNQDYLVAVWVGNNDNSPMSRVASGVTGASPIFNKIMTSLVANTESKPWSVPDKLVQTSICSFAGTLPCTGCPTKSEWFLEETIPQKACSPSWFAKKEDTQESGEESEDNKAKQEVFTITQGGLQNVKRDAIASY